MPFLHARDLTTEDFLSLVQNFSWPDDALLMAFSPVRAYFDLFRFDESLLYATDQGRVFSPEGELRWRHLASQKRVVYLGHKAPPAGLVDYSWEMEKLTSQKSELILWGIRTEMEDEWIEQQVPHRFAYPVSGKNFPRGRVALVVADWLDSSGLARFSRYHSLKEMPGGE